MSTRTTETTVTFRRPFALTAIDGFQPAGVYRVETDEELLPGLSFDAYRRIATMLHLPAISGRGGRRQVITIEPAELAAALEADSRD
jgi:hypothetical protein